MMNTNTNALRSRLSIPCLVVFFELLPLAAMFALRPPTPVGEDAPASEFSAMRAMHHVRAVAREPHPVGSADHARVLDYLVGRFAELGIPTEIQDLRAQGRPPLPSGGVELRNLLARIEGSQDGAAVALAAHYDSAPWAPGAADDGAAVAALLETARALRAGAPLRNDVIFIITDGEELGLLGAEGFVESHPWVREIGVVVNLEARGNRGPSILFETSEENGALLPELAGSLSRPVGNSLAYSVYRLLPNDTDLTVFKRAGLAGLNFAFIDGHAAYHREHDRPENLSLHSLQHHGEQVLALARRFGERRLPPEREPNAVYFDLCGRLLVHYPAGWALPGVLLVLAALVVALLRSPRRGALPGELGRALRAAAWDGLLVLAPISLGLVAVVWIRRTTGDLPTPRGESPSSAFFVLGVWNLALAALSLRLVRRASSGPSPRLHAHGFLLLWAIPMGLLGVLLPEASYLFVWPGLAGVLALASAGESPSPRPGIRSLAVALLGLPCMLLLLPAIYLLSLAVAPSEFLAVLVVSALATLTISLLFPQLSSLSGAAPRRGLIVGAVGAVLAFALEFLTSRQSW